MRYIRNISDDQNKAGDTDNIFRFNLLQGEDIFNFGDYPISINIANSSGYILSMVPEKEFGNSVVKLDFNDQSLKSLTPDSYLLEVEVKLHDGTTATFPTKGGMPFSVNSNLKNTAGQLVPTVTFDEVLNAVDEKVNNYLATVAKGDKGDPGDTILKSVAEFGAKGDGVTDDTAAIQAAIDAVHTEGGGEVHIPSGTYILSNSLTIYSYIKLVGSSQYAVTIKQTNVNAAHIYATDVVYPTIKDITFVGLGMDSAGGGGIFLTRQNNDNTEGVNFENVTVRNCAGSGITISCPITSVFTNVVCLGLVGSGFSFYGGGTSVVMNACYAITCTEAGFNFDQLNYSVLNACAVEVCGIGYYLHNNCNNISLIGCGSEDQIYRKPEYPGVDFQIEGGVGNSIISGYSRNNVEAGIRLFGGGKPVILSYRQIGTAKYSIVTDANVSGAIIQGESVSSPTSYASGTVNDFADDSKVLHNTGDENIDGVKSFTGIVKTTSDNSMIDGGGNDHSLAMVKKNGFSPFMALGSNAALVGFKVKKSGQPEVSPTDTFTDIFTVRPDGTTLVGEAQVPLAKDSSVVHKTGTETAAGDKTFTGTTTVKNVVSINVQTTNATISGFNMVFAETAMGVNVGISGTSVAATADGAARKIGTIPSGVTLPPTIMYLSFSVWAGVVGVTLRSGYAVYVSFNPNGDIFMKVLSMKENDNTGYNIQFDGLGSVTWVK